MADVGDITFNPLDIGEVLADIVIGARALHERVGRLLALSRDRTIALPMFRAVAARHGPVVAANFDAHFDPWAPTSVRPDPAIRTHALAFFFEISIPAHRGVAIP